MRGCWSRCNGSYLAPFFCGHPPGLAGIAELAGEHPWIPAFMTQAISDFSSFSRGTPSDVENGPHANSQIKYVSITYLFMRYNRG